MQWTAEAEAAIKKVPFFVRRKVRDRVEQETAEAGRRAVTLADVKASQKRYLARMGEELTGYRVEACFGAAGCPNRLEDGSRLLERIEAVMREADILSFLKQLGGRLGRHPRLDRELPGLYDADTVIAIVQASVDLYKARSRNGRRFAHLLTDADCDALAQRFEPLAPALYHPTLEFTRDLKDNGSAVIKPDID